MIEAERARLAAEEAARLAELKRQLSEEEAALSKAAEEAARLEAEMARLQEEMEAARKAREELLAKEELARMEAASAEERAGAAAEKARRAELARLQAAHDAVEIKREESIERQVAIEKEIHKYCGDNCYHIGNRAYRFYPSADKR